MNGREGTRSQVSFWKVVKRFLIIFLPLVVLLGGIVMVIYYADTRSEKIFIENSEIKDVSLQKKIIVNDLKSIVSDLLVLSSHHEIQVFLETGEESHLKSLIEEFLSFSYNKGLYDQVRLLDKSGMEAVRINFNDGKPSIVPKEQLQNKKDRYYFRETFQLEQGEVYISPFDLNIEYGEIEKPLKPMIRFGTPVFDSHGKKRGIVLLNYLGAKLIYDLVMSSHHDLGQVMLLNSDGFWLKGIRAEDEWGFMYEDGKNRTFGNAFSETWQRISGAESGQSYNAKGMFTFTTVYPILEGLKASMGSGNVVQSSIDQLKAAYYWKIISRVSPDVLYARSRQVIRRLILLCTAISVLLGIGSWMLAYTNISRKRAHEELKEARDFLESVIESSKDAIIITDEKGNILFLNTAIERITDFKKEGLIGKHSSILSVKDKETREKIIEKKAELFEKGSSIYESKLLKDGKYIDVECVSSMIKDNNKNYIAGVTIIRDITERKEMEHKILQSEKLRSLGELAGGVAHDFNNVLAAILGRAQLLKMSTDLPPGQRERRKFMNGLKKSLEIIEDAARDGEKNTGVLPKQG